MKTYLKEKFKYAWTLIFFAFYLVAFTVVEHVDFGIKMHVISTPIDRAVPFNEWFIIFYYLWFPFIAFTFSYLFFRNKKEYLKMMSFLYAGMALFICISFVFPNGLDLRPAAVTESNIAGVLTNALYAIDTPTNVLPSIHIYNSVGMTLALWQSDSHRNIKIGALVLSVLIILSTFFLKQHGIIDAMAAFGLSYVMYVIIYKHDVYLLKSVEEKQNGVYEF